MIPSGVLLRRLAVRIVCRITLCALIAAILLVCYRTKLAAAPRVLPPSPAKVLVVENTRSQDSVAIGDYYVRKRRVPAKNVCRITCPTTEECSLQEYREQIEEPVRAFLKQNRLKVDFLLLTKGIPIRTHEGEHGGFSTDSLLMGMEIKDKRTDTENKISRAVNPYFRQQERFTHARYNLYLVSRLIGYTRADCLKLVDNALLAKPVKVPFLLHVGPGHENAGYKSVNDGMREADRTLTAKGLQSLLSTKNEFAGGYTNLMGYFSWGSNDAGYNRKAYNSLGFVPGALAETAVSTSARTFENPNASGQSLIADLVAQGVTGCKGYVSEPFADSIALADILFDRYTSGYSLTESFWMASRWIGWKDMVIGDPLCAPYAK